MRKSLSFLLASCCLSVSCFAQAQPPTELSLDRQAALKAVRDKNPGLAVRLLSRWSKEYPFDLPLANDYAYALAQLGRFDQAREVLETALAQHELAGPAFSNLREILSRQASQEFAKALGQKPPATRLALRLSDEGPVTESLPPPEPTVLAARPKEAVVAASRAIAASPAAEPTPEVVASLPARERASISRGGAVTTKVWPEGLSEAVFSDLMQKWARAWATKDIDTYLDLYAQGFQTQAFASREAWAQSRRTRIVRPGEIVVEVSDVQSSPLENGQVEVRFRQRYESGSLKVNSSKRMLWGNEASGWKILREDGR